MTIETIIDAIHVLPGASRQLLMERVQEIEYRKEYLLIEANKIDPSLYFIKNGMVRAFSDTEKNEITFWFGKEGDPVLSMKSYIAGAPGYENIELIENTQLYKIEAQELYKLYKEDIHIANWGRKLAERELLKTEERLISREFKTALERYEDLIENNPYLVQRVPLGYLASYLGITQSSLSRIRAVYS